MPGCQGAGAVDYSLLVKIAKGRLARSPQQYIPLDLSIFREVICEQREEHQTACNNLCSEKMGHSFHIQTIESAKQSITLLCFIYEIEFLVE